MGIWIMIHQTIEWEPLHSVSNRDDPIKASKKNDRIFAIMTQRGGHLGWLERVGQSNDLKN